MTTIDAQITVYDVLPDHLYDAVWEMYAEAFKPLRKKAAQRHVLFSYEFNELMNDPRVSKILSCVGDIPMGLAVATNDLKAVTLIEPEFFQALEPELYDRGHVWYTLFVCVSQGEPRAPKDTFDRLINKVAEPVRAVRGVSYMDYADCNVKRGLPRAANMLLAYSNPRADYRQVDAQSFWAIYPAGRA